jgi:MFS family permease
LVFSFVVTLGTITVSLAKDFTSLLVGRTIFGLGSESLFLVQSAILAKWFNSKELALALSVALSFDRLGSILALWTLPQLAEAYSWRASLWFTGA